MAAEGLQQYYLQQIHELELHIRQRTEKINCLEAENDNLRNEVKMLREDMQLLKEPASYSASYVGEVLKVMNQKILVRLESDAEHDEKFVVDVGEDIDVTKLTPTTRVALRKDDYVLHSILPFKFDPLVNIMKVENVTDCTYDMIGGLDQQILELKEVIELPFREPELFENLGIAQPKSVLLYGPPGTGKTMLARAVAHHAKCTFIRFSGSELAQKFIGEGARLVRELFVMARKHAPSIIFMDEMDSVGSYILESSSDGEREMRRTLLELLNQLDGFEKVDNKIKVIMATNRIDIMDKALLRPGRIDRKIEFTNPNKESRLKILEVQSRKMNLVGGVDLMKIAEKMNGASGAELKAVCMEAGMFALRERRNHVTQEDFEMGAAKIMNEKEAANVKEKEKRENISLQKIWI